MTNNNNENNQKQAVIACIREQLVKYANVNKDRLDNFEALASSFTNESERVDGIPYSFFVEPTNICNLSCPLCPTGTGEQNRNKGYMNMDVYNKLLSDISESVFEIHFGFQGEPMLHPKLDLMIYMANKLNIQTRLFSNFNVKNDILYTKLVNSGLCRVTISLDGNTQNTYEQYRIGGNINQVLHNIETISNCRSKSNSAFPLIEVQALMLNINESSMDSISILAQNAGADILKVKCPSLPIHYLGLDKSLSYQGKINMYDEFGNLKNISGKETFTKLCRSIYFEPGIVCWDGSVAMCCRDVNAKYLHSNIGSNASFKEIWNCRFMKELRSKMIYSENSLEICKNCPTLSMVDFVLESRQLKHIEDIYDN